jgi:hypothetical protein
LSQTTALRHRDQLLNEGLNSLRLWNGGLDLTVLKETGSEIAKHRATVSFLQTQLLAKYTMTHEPELPNN